MGRIPVKAVLLAVLLFLSASPVSATSAIEPNSGMAWVQVGTKTYLMGGLNTIDIFEFDASNETIRRMTSRLSPCYATNGMEQSAPEEGPSAGGDGASSAGSTQASMNFCKATSWHGAQAVWLNNSIYIFGGQVPSASAEETDYTSDLIFRFDPVADTMALLDLRLPFPEAGATAASDGRDAYLFAGCSVLQFIPSVPRLVELDVALPYSVGGATAVWTGGNFWIVGGAIGGYRSASSGGDDSSCDHAYRECNFCYLLRFSPQEEAPQIMTVPVPAQVVGAMAADLDGNLLIVGGVDDHSGSNSRIQKYDPQTNSLTTLDVTLPQGVAAGALNIHGNQLFVLGGHSNGAQIGLIQNVGLSLPSTTLSTTSTSVSTGESATTDESGRGAPAINWFLAVLVVVALATRRKSRPE